MKHGVFRQLGSALIIGAWIAAAAAPAIAQEVESVFLAALDGEGYYVPKGGIAKLEVAALADLRDQRPVELGARLEIKHRHYGERSVLFEETADLAQRGQKDSSGVDRWYLPGFAWRVACDDDGHTVRVNGRRVGKSPIDFTIQIGMVMPPEDDAAEDAPMLLEADSVAESRRTRIVCGKYSPLPKPQPRRLPTTNF